MKYEKCIHHFFSLHNDEVLVDKSKEIETIYLIYNIIQVLLHMATKLYSYHKVRAGQTL